MSADDANAGDSTREVCYVCVCVWYVCVCMCVCVCVCVSMCVCVLDTVAPMLVFFRTSEHLATNSFLCIHASYSW